LTAREPVEVGHTQRQLQSVGICLSNASYPEKFWLKTQYPSLYECGVIYCGDNTKADSLIAFFQMTEMFPKKIVFIDDKKKPSRKASKQFKANGSRMHWHSIQWC
jgi:hypothetical protein